MRRGIGCCLLVMTLFTALSASCRAESAKPTDEQMSPLFQAIRDGDAALVQRLVEQNPALVNAQNSHGINPLMGALFQGDEEIVKLLVSKGADVNAEDGPLETAAYAGKISVVEHLIANGADVNKTNYWGHTALFGAAEGGWLDIAKLLIDRGTKVNVQGDFGATALSIAVENGHPTVVKLLIEKGADVNLAKEDGTTPLHQATNAYTANLLISKGADVDAVDKKGLTPLHVAAFFGRVPVIRVLLQKGADLSTKTTAEANLGSRRRHSDVALPAGLTPREFAERAGQKEVVNLLAEAEAGRK